MWESIWLVIIVDVILSYCVTKLLSITSTLFCVCSHVYTWMLFYLKVDVVSVMV